MLPFNENESFSEELFFRWSIHLALGKTCGQTKKNLRFFGYISSVYRYAAAVKIRVTGFSRKLKNPISVAYLSAEKNCILQYIAM